MATLHYLKIGTRLFTAIKNDLLRCHYRKYDREFKKGDWIHYEEYDVDDAEETGWVELAKILYILIGPEYNIPDGYCILSLKVAKGESGVVECMQDIKDES
jgi:hypothetical protein